MQLIINSNHIILYINIIFTTLSSSPMHFSEAQNSTNIQNDTHQIYVPATISKEAQDAEIDV